MTAFGRWRRMLGKTGNGSQQRVCNLIHSGLPFCGIGVFLVFFDAGEEILAVFFPLAMLSQYVFGPALFLISLFIVLIILLQRGRGGGLTGALGGAGGASAFGVKAGDIFTRITAVSVLLWIVLCALTCFWYLPDALNIASDPASLNPGKTVPSMGSKGANEALDLDTLPVETPLSDKAPPVDNAAPVNLTPTTDLPPAVKESSSSTEPVVKPLPTDLPPAPANASPLDIPKSTSSQPAETTAPGTTEPKP